MSGIERGEEECGLHTCGDYIYDVGNVRKFLRYTERGLQRARYMLYYVYVGRVGFYFGRMNDESVRLTCCICCVYVCV